MTTLLARALALLLLLAATALHAQVPQLINYQGRVAVGTVNFDGSGAFKFALVNGDGTVTYWSNDGTSTAGSEPATAVSLSVTKGLYSVLLGDATLLHMTIVPATVFNNPDVRLRVWFDDGNPLHGSQLLTPDQRIAAVGYAMMAGNAATVADGAITSAKLADGAVGTAQLANNAVTAANMAAGAVGSAQLAEGAVGTSQLAANAVQSANIAAGAVGRDKIAAGAVSGDGWSGIPPVPVTGRLEHTAVWTGTEMIVWGGLVDNHIYLNTGGRYNPVTKTWTLMSTTGAPDARYLHTAVWTGTEMIVWGGYNDNGDRNTGARYNPATDTWTTMSTIGAPAARESQTAVWTGTEMLIWGGASSTGGPTTYPNDVGRYTPAGNGGAGTWTIIPGTLPNTPTGRYNHVAVWTGSEMIVWGGDDGSIWNTGGRYNPAANGGVGSWTAVNTTGAPSARDLPAVVWTGSEMIVWGGIDADGASPDGGRYNPAGDSWTAINAATPSSFAPDARYFHTAVWTGSEMIVWGGENAISPYFLSTGGRYNPTANGGAGSWTALTSTGVPAARAWHTAVWTGNDMVVWGGFSASFTPLADGGRLRLGSLLAGSVGSSELALGAVRTLNLANASVSTAQLAPNLVLGGTTTGAFAGNGAGLTNIPGTSITGPLPDSLCCHIIENRTSDPANPENGRIWLRIDLP